MMLNLYKIECSRDLGYDTYDSAVVVATSPEEARTIHPDGSQRWHEGRGWVYAKGHDGQGSGWVYPSSEHLAVVCVGTARDGMSAGEVVCSSFNAG